MSSRERIIQAAKELYFRNGIRSVTMDDIARHMGISKKTLYRFFKDKDRVVLQVTKTYLKDRQETFGAVKENSKDAVHEILQTMSIAAEMFRSINPLLFYDLRKYYPASWNQFLNFKEECVTAMVQDNLERGIKNGLYRKEINPKILSRLRLEEVEMAMDPETFPPGKFNMVEIHIALLDHFLHGIITPKGYKLIEKYKPSMKF